MTQGGPAQPLPGERDSVSVQAVQALAGAGFLTKSGQPWDRATLAVVIIPGTPPSLDDTNAQSQQLVTLAEQLNLAGLGTVVAGTVAGSGPGSAIDVMRAGGRAGHLTSVDDADYAIGQIVVAQSLADMEHGKSGSYGVTANASAAGPSPPPESRAHRVAHRGDPSGARRPGQAGRDQIGEAISPGARRPGAPRHSRPATARPATARPATAAASAAAALAAGAAAGAARAAYAALSRRPPGGTATWTRTNHRGDQLTLLEGPALAAGSVAVSVLGPGLPPGVRATLAVASTGAAAFGGYDDLAGSGGRRGDRGHLGALARGEVTTGAVKLGGIGATGLVSAALLGGGPFDVAIDAGADRQQRQPAEPVRPAPGPRAQGGAGRRNAPWPPGPPHGPRWPPRSAPRSRCFPEDLGERAMLGDAGANALGALLGTAAAASLSRPARLALLAMVTGLTAASEVVSFTAVIERTPALRWLDMLGRRPVPAAPVPGRDDTARGTPGGRSNGGDSTVVTGPRLRSPRSARCARRAVESGAPRPSSAASR